MAILGYNTQDGSGGLSLVSGRIATTKFTLGSAQVLNELHAWVQGNTGQSCRLVIYADSSGVPGARVAYSTVKSFTGSIVELVETGFSVSLPAADYWIGVSCITSTGTAFVLGNNSGASSAYHDSTPDPPPDPYGTASGLTRKMSVWAVVVSGSTTWNGSSTVSLTDTITTAGARLGVTVHGVTTTSMTVTVTTGSHAVTLHGSTTALETVTVTTVGLERMPLVPRAPGSLVLVPRPPDLLVLTPR